MGDEIKLKYESGNILSAKVHKIGIIALGSHRENHGTSLPIDTDSKIASYVALSAAIETGASFLGIFYAATEYDYIKHGKHLKKDELISHHIIPQLITAKNSLKLESIIIVNGHGGNNLLLDSISRIEEETGLKILFNNSIIEDEGPHACTGELSMGAFIGITDENKIREHGDFKQNPEVGMVGLTLARENEPIINSEAEYIEENGFEIDYDYGKKLLDNAKKSVIQDVKHLI